jgi:1-acyl-sn-glycerol-3-phosphate acyltransferase
MVGELPRLNKAVFIAAPHTSNWDGFWLIIYKFAIDAKVSFLGKASLFWWPLGRMLAAIGCIPVDRHDAAGIVPQLVDAFRAREHLFLALAPEGTRKWQPYWKTGFYRIAEAANVPIVLAFIDYGKREMGMGPALPMGLARDEVQARLALFYAAFKGRHPALQGPVAFAPRAEM